MVKLLSMRKLNFKPIMKYEVYFFYALILINLIPVLVVQYFPTVDGPAHLYNSKLITELLSDSDGILSRIFVFNDNLNPNWAGHFILSGLLYVFPAYLSEKILLLSYLVLFPVSFRYLFKKLNLKETYILYFVFPFTYSFLFYYGFYNFHLGLVFLFFAIGLWIKYLNRGIDFKGFLVLLILSICIYFSHLFILAVLFVVIAAINLHDIIYIFRSHKNKKQVLTNIFLQIAILLFVICLSILYFYSNPVSHGNYYYINANQLLTHIRQIHMAKGISYGNEGIFTKWISILLALILIYLTFIRLRSFRQNISRSALIWGFLTGLVLIGVFIFPDGTGTFGFISSRMILFFFLFLIIFLGTQKVPFWVALISFLIINYVNIALINVYTVSGMNTKGLTENIIKASEKISPNSTVLPINDSNYFLFKHVSNYLGVSKPMIILHNYEASLNYFPLKWNMKDIPQFHLGDKDEILDKFPRASNPVKEKVQYVFVLRNSSDTVPGDNEKSIARQLKKYYKRIYFSDDKTVLLYKSTPQPYL